LIHRPREPGKYWVLVVAFPDGERGRKAAIQLQDAITKADPRMQTRVTRMYDDGRVVV